MRNLLAVCLVLVFSGVAVAGHCNNQQNIVVQKQVARIVSPHQQLAVVTYDYVPQNVIVREQVVQQKVVKQQVQKVVTRQPLLNRLGQALQNAFPVRQRVVQQQIVKHH